MAKINLFLVKIDIFHANIDILQWKVIFSVEMLNFSSKKGFFCSVKLNFIKENVSEYVQKISAY